MKDYVKQASLMILRWAVVCALGLIALPAYSQDQQPDSSSAQTQASQDMGEPDTPGDWAPELLDAILTSKNTDARQTLLDATFAAGPDIIPQLESALKDDRTAEFAAQSLAFIGSPKAFTILGKLAADKRDLDLRRFFYGALGELRTPESTQFLTDAIAHSDDEPDRTVTEAAIIAMTVRSDATLIPSLRDAEKNIHDVVIRDDLENAMDVIQARAKYLATPQGQSAGGAIESAVKTYFSPALDPPSADGQPAATAAKVPATRRAAPKRPAAGAGPGKITAKPADQPLSLVSVSIESLAYSPNKRRALAHVIFQDPMALAHYDMVLKKDFGDWVIASVWLGTEEEKTPPTPATPSSPEN